MQGQAMQRKVLARSLQPCKATRRLATAGRSGRRQIACQAASQDASSLSGRSPLLYSPILKAMRASSGARSELERQLFGGASSKPTAQEARSARTVSEMQSLMSAAADTDAFDAAFLTAVLSSLPKLRKHHQKDASKQDSMQLLVDDAVARLLPLLDSLDAQAVVSVTVALAKLGYTDAGVYRQLVGHIQAGEMSAQGLSNLMWALATAGVRPGGAWLSEFWAELENQLDNLSGQDIANIFWSICRLEIMPPWVSGSMPGMLSAALQRVGNAPTGQDPATVMVCLAIWSRSYSYHPPEELLNEMLTCMQPHLKNYVPQDLVSCVHSLVVLNASPSRAWMTDFYMVLRDRLIFDPTLSYSDFQRLLWALSRIDYVPSQAWLRHFVEVSIVKLKHLRFRALSELVWALACWGYTPTKEWLQEYFRVTYRHLANYKPPHLANSLLALKKLGCKVPTAWLDAALVSFCDQLSSAKAHDLVTFIDGVVDVCEDAAWMSRPATRQRLRSLADHAASKFDIICDVMMHAKLLVALATAKCFPGVAWLTAQQDSLVRSLESEAPGAVDSSTLVDMRAAYAAWDVPLSPVLAQELEAQSRGE